MMKILAFSFMMLFFAAPVSAQMSPDPAAPSPVMPPMPSGAVPAPVTATPEPAVRGNSGPGVDIMPPPRFQSVQAPFPTLPPSRPCLRKDLIGIWKLLEVHEEPPGAEIAEYQNSPVQYLSFDRDNIFGEHISGRTDLSIQGIRDAMQNQMKNVPQYLVHETGLVYFYKNGVAVDTQACFIVANQMGNFLLGQMLLMPPQGSHPGRLVRSYTKIWEPEPPKKRGKAGKR